MRDCIITWNKNKTRSLIKITLFHFLPSRKIRQEDINISNKLRTNMYKNVLGKDSVYNVILNNNKALIQFYKWYINDSFS